MNHPVLLKGNSIGLTMVLDPEMKFEQLKAAICEKFTQAKDFFNGQTQIALKIEGRKLTSPQLSLIHISEPTRPHSISRMPSSA